MKLARTKLQTLLIHVRYVNAEVRTRCHCQRSREMSTRWRQVGDETVSNCHLYANEML